MDPDTLNELDNVVYYNRVEDRHGPTMRRTDQLSEIFNCGSGDTELVDSIVQLLEQLTAAVKTTNPSPELIDYATKAIALLKFHTSKSEITSAWSDLISTLWANAGRDWRIANISKIDTSSIATHLAISELEPEILAWAAADGDLVAVTVIAANPHITQDWVRHVLPKWRHRPDFVKALKSNPTVEPIVKLALDWGAPLEEVELLSSGAEASQIRELRQFM